ncbi:SLC13 family permease [Crenobacter sp. SG2303]|uniref:SLC13 family permease n=1 Tax=Crenobacter oryzisoli TaxID=3056844 RepID=A0ABT7XJU1_9NEIS|nr:SLC13 family permease [Crenobacter sp. SG2303]MDN0074038.1 SLC13 family permease [Crenobacter sp. SG2303]
MPIPVFLSAFTRSFRRDRLLHALFVAGFLLMLVSPLPWRQLSSSIDYATLATLAGLMVLTKGIEESGYLDHLGASIVARLRHERSLALFLVAAAAALSTVLTNDIALFIIVPLTVGLSGVASLPIGRLVVFEALAVNAGSMLTPIGNPQNILLWQKSGLSFVAFIVQMAPLALAIVTLLLLVTCWAFPARPISAVTRERWQAYSRGLLGACVVLYLAFLLLLDLGHLGYALLLVLAGALLAFRRVLIDVDWSLIAVFALMFVDIRLLTGLPLLRDLLAQLGQLHGAGLFLAGIGLSQLISNVPAAILLTEYSQSYRLIAYAVNVGGFGFALGSLANLIALRMAGTPGIWRSFHRVSLPFLLVVALGGWVALSWR